MTSETSGKLGPPNFVMVPIVMLRAGNENIGEAKEYIKGHAMINPVLISSYFPAEYVEGEVKRTATCVIVGGHSHYADMEMQEFSALINNIDRSYNLDFVENK